METADSVDQQVTQEQVEEGAVEEPISATAEQSHGEQAATANAEQSEAEESTIIPSVEAAKRDGSEISGNRLSAEQPNEPGVDGVDGATTAGLQPEEQDQKHVKVSSSVPVESPPKSPALPAEPTTRNGGIAAISQGIRAPALASSSSATFLSKSGRRPNKQLETSRSAPATPALSMSSQSLQSIKEGELRPVYTAFANQDDLLTFEKLIPLLQQMGISFSSKDLQVLISSLSPDIQALTFEETMVVCGLLQGPAAAQQQRFSRFLSQRRTYMQSGVITVDEAVTTYMRKLEDHRKKCEGSGRYPEARAAMQRLAELKTAQAVKIKQDLAGKQQQELEDVRLAFNLAQTGFCDAWDVRVREYELAVAKQVEELQNIHQQQLTAFIAEMESRKPVKPKFSREYLNNRKIEEHLAKQGEYVRAQQVKTVADSMYTAELDATIATWEAEVKVKQARLVAKQQQEVEVVMQKGARGRGELDTRRNEELEKKMLRYKATVAELQNLHRLELVNFENFLEGQAIAGKFERLKESSFRRKRELLVAQF